MKRNSDLRNTWSSCLMQMLKRQTRVKGAVVHVGLSYSHSVPGQAKKQRMRLYPRKSGLSPQVIFHLLTAPRGHFCCGSICFLLWC